MCPCIVVMHRYHVCFFFLLVVTVNNPMQHLHVSNLLPFYFAFDKLLLFMLRCVLAGSHKFVFLVRGHIILVAVACTQESVTQVSVVLKQ